LTAHQTLQALRSHPERLFCCPLRIAAALLIAVALLVVPPAEARSVSEWEIMPRREATAYVVGVIGKMVADLAQPNPALAAALKEFFVRPAPARDVSEGLLKFYVEVSALDMLAGTGKLDPDRIQVEGVIVKLVKDKFPPQQWGPRTPAPGPAVAGIKDAEASAMTAQCAMLAAVADRQFLASSVKDFEFKIPAQQSRHLARLIARMTEQADPQTAEYVRRFFAAGGVEQLTAKVAALNTLGQQGKVDLSKLRLSAVAWDVVIANVDKDLAAILQRRKEIDDRAIKLHDGRRAYVDGDRFRDENGKILQGQDHAEARQKLREIQKGAR